MKKVLKFWFCIASFFLFASIIYNLKDFQYSNNILNESKIINVIEPSLVFNEKDEPVFNETKKYVKTVCSLPAFDDLKIESLKKDIINYVSKYKVSFEYYNINRDYNIKHNTAVTYFSASVFKLIDLIYLINKSNTGEIDLHNTTVKFNLGMVVSKTDLMAKYTGNEISLYELMKYVMLKSDNTAHKLLVNYIGINTLRTYGTEVLGTTFKMNNTYYASLNLSDTMIYLKEIYKLIELDNENSKFLIENLENNYFNSLNFKEEAFLHKYGMTDSVYHDVGIKLNDNPYFITILSRERYNNYKEIFQTISEKIYNLDKMINTENCENILVEE